ncbi:MAG: multiubiquitin domain-containing protein [Burkholderiaceae bacterium]
MSHDKSIHVFINGNKFELEIPFQTGASLKHLAGISLQDVLFLQSPGDDEVIANDSKITLKNGDHFHSQPPADYGFGNGDLDDAGINCSCAAIQVQPDGWSFLVISDYKLPEGFEPQTVNLLIKLPPAFPDAQPDMFWVHPAVKTASGTLPRATSTESLLGKEWQRFSWHLKAGAWQPGISTLRDFMRCIASRFIRKD